MPVPTDTFWNMKRLNWVFAASSILLVAVTAWTVAQDYGGWWRQPQQNNRVWEAALAHDNLDRLDDQQLKDQKAKVEADIAAAEKQIGQHKGDIDKLNSQIHQFDSERATMEFELNTQKANVNVDE